MALKAAGYASLTKHLSSQEHTAPLAEKCLVVDLHLLTDYMQRQVGVSLGSWH